MSPFRYPATVKVDTAGFYLVTFPDVPEAGTDANTREEALREAVDALIAALGGYVHARRPIPKPSKAKPGQTMITLPTLVTAKLALYEAMREAGSAILSWGVASGSAKGQSGDCWIWIIAPTLARSKLGCRPLGIGWW